MHSQTIAAFGEPLESAETPTPTPVGTEVLIRVEHCGVCHSDLHIHEGSFDLGGGGKLSLTVKLPHTLGHEIAGEVIAMGPEATGVGIGDHRAVYPWIGCGRCPACLRGEENYCNAPRNLGCSSGVPGGYATHVIAPHSRYLFDYGQTPPGLAATYMCSGLTAYSAMKKVGSLGPKDEVVVLGAGGVGMMGLQFARRLFGKSPLVADIDEGRLEAAKAAGAKAVYNTQRPESVKQLVADTEGGAYAVVDFVGSEATFAFAQGAVRRGGRIIIVGLFGGAMGMPLPMFPLRALTIGGSFVGTLAETEEMMEMVRAGQIDPIPVQTRRLDAANSVLDDLRGGRIIGRVVLAP